MVQYNKNIKNKKKGFTLVELMVVLAITAILAALVGGGLIAYTRLARFEKNEANARTLFQTAQISLTRMETAGELDAFRRQAMEEGDRGDHFQNDVTVTDAGGNTLVSRTKTELNQNVAALYYDRTGAAAGNHNALVERLLGDYIYDASLLNASICVEIDVQSGQIYSVFYDTKSDKLRFNQDGATNIYDRSYDHRRNDTLVGYYSAEDRVNVVQLVQTKLKVKNPRLTNGETLTLSWSGNSSLGDLDTSYTATAYDAKDTGKTKPLFTITIKRDTAGAADDNKQVITEMPVVIYQYDAAGQQTGTEEKKLYFPLSYNKGSFVLTLDAMADAALLRACENSADVAATSLYSITRLLNDPKDIYIAMRAEPRENYSDTYTASKEETTNEENTLLAKGGTAVTADLKYFRHLYNLRWSADWDITNKATYTLTPQASNSTGLNWTGGGVTVYCASGERYPAAKVPSLNDPVAWPTIPELGEKIELTSKTTVLATKTTRVPILNLQLSSKSVAKTGRAGKDELGDHYVGLIGENKGKISYITLRDPDIQVNVKTETVDAGTLPKADQLKLTATKFVTALAKDDENWRDVRAVGALCGVNTGTLENLALTRGTNSSTSALVAAALAFDNTTTATQRNARTLDASSYTYYTDEPRGIGGLVGVAIPKAESVMQDLTVASDVTVAGLLVDKDTQSVANTAADQQAEKARYAAAAAEPGTDGSLWRSVGVGGVFGTVDAAKMQTTDKTNIVNNGFVTGNGFTGGIVGNLFTTGANTSTPLVLTGLRNNGTVSAGANYKGDTAGDARSLVLGQFFGGIAGYGRGVTLQGCESVTRSDLTETQLKKQVKAGFDKTGALTDASPLKGDFVGGLVGYGKEIVLNDCKTGKGYVLGSRFVGGLAGGFTGSGVHIQKNDTNSSDVFGSRYVGGIVSVNGGNSQISGMTNTGLVAAFGKNAAYVGGIVGVNDADWGGSQDPNATATVQNCANRMSGDNATDTRRINLLKDLSGCADYVGGIAGCNVKNGVVTWDTSTPTLGAILYGNNYVGGVAGYNDENATISNTSGQNLTISGQIVAAGKAVGGMIGLNCASTLPSATVKVSRVAGQQLVGGVIGANLPVGGFTVTGGAFTTDVASGRVEADAVAGGIIGYNRLLAPKPADVTLAALLPKIDESTGVLTDSTAVKTADYEVTLANFQNKLNLQADIYVGGIVGANDANTKLTIQNATNGATQNALSVGGLNPSNGAFKEGVSLNALAGGRYDFDTPRGALAGGIIGYATPNTTLKDCTNYGTVAHKCAAGGFAGWNEGTITGGSMAASLGNRETGYTYLGGVAGVNGGLIQSAYPAQGCAVRGDSYVGGIAGVNLGGDAAVSTRKGLIICTENNSTGTVEANQYAGGVAGANVGSISLSGQLQSSVTATGYAGGVAGINTDKGSIYGADNATGAVLGSVTAANYAGGVAGTNSAEITRVENRASVRASTQYAGGIAGENAAGGTISYCSHAQNQVYATNGEAGGIAGNNNKDALIENVQVSAAVTAANGTAGGVTATNFGIIGQDSELESSSSVSGCTITGTSESIGAVAAYNRAGATIRNVKLAENANVQFSTPAVTIGGLAGMNEGTVTGCQVENGALALDAGLRAGTNTVTLGGAVGRTTEHGTVSSTDVLLDLTQNLDKYTNLGGVAGQNDGTLDQCTYSGTMGGNADTDGLVSVGARSTGSTVGGIAGLNNSTITGCEVKYIKLQVSGISNITTTQTADEKLASASHVGGIAGRNNAKITKSYVATERSGNAGSIITARYGFVGGVAGSNNGTITGSGSKKALVSDEEATPALVAQVDNWLDAADANAGINSMAAELTTGKTYAGLKGVDTVTGYGYTNVYSDTGLAANDLLVALRGSNNSETVRAAGYLGGLAGFNSLRGTIDTSATGQWFVYSDNATTASTVGGIVGQNESNVTDKSVLDTVVNCAAVRRFTRVKNEDDTDDDNIYKVGSRVVVHVGGVIGQQQNRSDDRWSVSKVVNCGSVFNSRSANVGGVIAYWLDYGGTVQKCFNFGKITTNTNDKNSGYGAVGGIVGFIDQPISGGTTNVLSCRNYGQIWYDSNGANDCAGIIGKIEMKKPTDIMTLNIIDCVNSGAIKAESQAVGILAWIGPWDKGRIDNVTVNIDRCRNLNTVFTCGRKIGIVGSRGDGRGSNKATNVTNCFATVGTDWFPIAYLRLSGENVTGHGNYYIEDSGDKGKSFFKKDSRKLTTVKPNSTTGNWEKADKQGSDSAYNETYWDSSSKKVKAHRLYIGYNVTDKATDPYIAFLPALAEGGNGAAYSLWWMRGITSTDWNAAANSAYIKTDGKKAYIFDDTGADDDTNPGKQRATVMLQFGEAANSTDDSDVDITDITDEVIQNYYKYVLDSTKPAQPGEIHVKASQVQDADNNVYGRYEVTWGEPNDTTASPAAYYRVEILPCDAAGNVAAGAPYLKADVYQRSYTFVADKAWTGNFVVRVTPYNTNDDPNQADNFNTSGVQTFMHALPTPEIEFRLVKRTGGGFDWNQCQTPDEKRREFKYEVVAVLKNYTEYPTDEAWTVKLTDGRYTYYFSRQNGKQYIRLTQNLERTLTLTALATPDNSSSTKYLRSAQYKSETYLPSQWRDNLHSDKDEDGLPLGTLNKDGSTEYVTYTGQTAESFEATVKFSFTPRVKNGSEHGSPTYRVMLLAKYLGNDEVNGVSLNGQYITLAAREGIVTGSPVTFNLNSLPSDAMTNYTDFLVVAVPITSGKGDMKYRWDATADEVSAAIASHANETNDTDKEIWWKNGYEIVRTGEHSYTYAHLTPLCFSDVNRTDDPEWAEQATQTTPQIIFKQLNLNVLKAPTLAETIEDGVVDNNNQLTYTFKWTQDDMQATDAAPDYQIKLYGLLMDKDGNVTGQEQIALKDGVNLAKEVQNSGNSFTLPVNVDTMLANGSDSWRYDKVRLEVTRVAAAGTDEIGASAVADYSVKQRLPGISAPSSITRVNGETDNADALLYTVSWSPSDNARIDHYDLCVVDAGGKPVLTLPTTGNVGSLTLDMEQYQGVAMSFRVIARRKDDSCFDGPDGALSQPETIVRRADAPVVENVAFDNNSPNQETFLNDLKLNMTLEEAAEGNVYFTGYIFSDADKYTEIANLAKAWQDEGTGQAKYEAQQELTKKLDEMLNSGDAELVIPKDSRTVGGSASVNDKTASYTFVPDGNGFTLTPDHAKQYLLPAVRVMPTDGTTASNWFYFLQQDAAKAQLPAITLDAPVDAAEPERALGNAVYTQEVNLYNDPEFKSNRGTAPLELRRFTVEWTAVNKYTQADGTVRNLTDSYTFTVTPLDSKTKQPYSITVTTYDRDETDEDGTTHKRGEIKTVTKTYDGKTTEIAKQTDDVDKETGKTRIWYDLSVEPVTDENGNVTWKSQPYNVTGTVEKDGGTLYYKAQTVPMLELVQEDGAEPVYRITLPELQEKVQDDSLALQKFTASVTLQTLAHSIGDDKTVASDSVKVTVNGTNTADGAEDAQSMDSAESVAPVETAESTAAESAPASVPPVLMRARAALPMATPETAAAPDETDAAETAPPKQTGTSDAS